MSRLVRCPDSVSACVFLDVPNLSKSHKCLFVSRLVRVATFTFVKNSNKQPARLCNFYEYASTHAIVMRTNKVCEKTVRDASTF